MLKYEIRKMFNIYSLIGILFVVLLTVVQIFVQYNTGISIGLVDSSYHFKGKEFIERNKEISDSFSGKIMDDQFFLEFDAAVLHSIESDNNGNFNAKGSLQMSSLYQLYGKLRTTEYETLGIESTDMDSVFGDNKPTFFYTDNWEVMRAIISSVQLLLIFIGCIIPAPLFSKEYADGMTQIIHTMPNGKHKFALTKIIATVIVITLIYIFIIGMIVISVGVIWGFHNPFADVRVMTNASYIAMNGSMSCVELIFFQIILGYFSILFVSAIATLCSALIPRTTTVLVTNLIIVTLPQVLPLEKISSTTIQKIIALLPADSINLLTKTWSVYNYNLSVIYLSIMASLLLAVMFYVASVFFYIRHKYA